MGLQTAMACFISKLKCNLLTDGYIHSIQKSMPLDKIIPNSINRVCFDYYYEFDSAILSSSEIDELERLLQESQRNIGSIFNLIYRASRDGFGYDEWYNRCKD